jgi:hypothetical protein
MKKKNHKWGGGHGHPKTDVRVTASFGGGAGGTIG